MPLAEELVALSSLAGNAVVAAAATDAWETARRGIVRIFGRSGSRQAQLAARRLDETRSLLLAISGDELTRVQASSAEQWAMRLADFLEEDAEAEADLRMLVRQVSAQLPTRPLLASDYSIAAGRDVIVKQSGGGVAAGVIHTEAVAGQGGIAIGRIEYHRREVASRPVSLAPRPPYLAGRDKLLSDLASELETDDGPQPRIRALYGLAGAGKTTIALEYAHRQLAEAGIVWQFPAEDPTVLGAEFARLADQLDVIGSGDPVAAVHGILAASPLPWLLLFDNAPNQAAVRAFLPPAGPGRLLITSQSALWSPQQAVEVPVLDDEVAARFLTVRTGDPDEPAALQLAAELGGLPLALEQAAAYIQASDYLHQVGGKLAWYLDLFRTRKAELLNKGEVAAHAGTVTTTLALAFGRLAKEAPDADSLLHLMACCAPDEIPLGLLLRPPSEHATRFDPQVRIALARLVSDPLAVADAITALRKYSLVNLAGDGLISVHRLVQAVALALVPAELAAQWRQAAAVLIESAIPADTGQRENWPIFAALLPHARAVLADESAGMAQIADYLSDAADRTAARDLYRSIANARERHYGPDHEDTLLARLRLARMTGEASNPDAALQLLNDLLPDLKRNLGPDHALTLEARTNKVRWIGESGNPVAAAAEAWKLQPDIDRALGPLHPDSITARHNLAAFIGRAGDSAAARDMYAEVAAMRERTVGPRHNDTLVARYQFANFIGGAGDTGRARDQFAELVPLFEEIRGADHPFTVMARARLAKWTLKAGDPADARDQLTALLPDLERVLGPEHRETLAARGHLKQSIAEAAGPEAETQRAGQ